MSNSAVYLLSHELIQRSVWIYLKLSCSKNLSNKVKYCCWLGPSIWFEQPLCGLCLAASEGVAAFVGQRIRFLFLFAALHRDFHCPV